MAPRPNQREHVDMNDERYEIEGKDPWYGPAPDLDAGDTTVQVQTGREGEWDEPLSAPIDTRDAYGNAGPALSDPTVDVELEPEVDDALGGPYPLPSVIERPHTATAPGSAPHQPTRDPSLSRAVDREAAGLDPAAAGFDRSGESSADGPLDPDVEQQPASDEHPAGTWGSSG